ncbi:TonB system transport protein TonB [Xenorhabdus sp. 42]|uniref:Protein TonB n=2 Tax=Xenorhabdus szentirmaii TaxID=290112 RepID=W1IQE4_9GAMM|nr:MULTISPECIES: TonB system transport protein TonB [Xenorhabdus]MBD2792689.1 TonB system transport protein TonB [Xenorhabdus sp. CUL]MBD2805733.1 TonB system transport protein TonB [Xenorhabdus sp. ZM]MBD2821283.1 TonB system transport protein TonB [Xenorhabdus sp. 42]MBD2823563.1 TonB system transport protein TonB [Xenorhabdus sp. 5]PHM32497.1 transporter [Xenorhabdus szentirmaii DSM 16338]
MLLIKNSLMRWIHWPILLSVCLHISIAMAIFKAIESEQQPAVAPMSVAMIQLAAEETPVSQAAMSESIPEPEPAPEPIAKIALPKPEKKPEVKKREEKKIVKKESKPAEKKQEKVVEQPLEPVSGQETQLAENLNTKKPASLDISNDAPKALAGPKALNRPNPDYPNRARQLGTEGSVKVKYDIDEYGRVRNITILASNPKNTFDREVKQVMKKWRYEKVPATGYITTIEFKLTGISQS